VPGFHRQDYLLCLAAFGLVMEIEAPINALIAPLLLFNRSCSNKAKRPPLKLIRVLLGEFGRVLL